MKDKLRHKGQQNLKYNLNKLVQKGTFDILKYISENVTLVQLMDTPGNVNNVISIVDYCISDSNYKKAIHMKRE